MEKNTKYKEILDAAEKIMFRKGLNQSSISEIATAASVKEPLIYNYFKGKEDLLFSIPLRRMVEVIDNLSTQLRGILNPLSKLQKMIWFHLEYNDTFRDYAGLLLLECRGNPSFYMHPAYALIRQYAGIMLNILREGVETHVFGSDININLLRDVILGLLDWETLSCIALEEVNETTPDFEAILSLITPMLAGTATDATLDKPALIMRAAEVIFSEKGYKRATIAQIAKEADVSEGTIYEHFESKEALLFSLSEKKIRQQISDSQDVFETRSPLRKLERFAYHHFLMYLKDRDFLRIFLLDCQLNRLFYKSESHKLFQQLIGILERILEEGKLQGSMRSNLNVRVARNLFLGSLSHMALKWVLLQKKSSKDKMQEINQFISLLIKAVQTA